MKHPQFLYHYTTIESLAMILSSQSIRFSPLNVLDDIQEERSQEQFESGRFIYISSWMESNEESIPMWNMYSNMESGVRIKLSTDPFQKYEVIGSEGISFTSIISQAETYDKPYSLANRGANKILLQVEYTNDENKITPKLVAQDGQRVQIKLGELGKYKKKCWAFQNEWRYRLIFIPIGWNDMLDDSENVPQRVWDNIHDNHYRLPFQYYFMKISHEKFLEMEITLSPKISPANRVIVEALKDKYNPTMTILDSALQDDIR